MAIEALPICIHRLHCQIDAKCLYVYRDPFEDFECGFWVHDMPPVKVILIPQRWGHAWAEWFRGQFAKFLPDVDIIETGANGGSGDPFLLIEENAVKQLPDWRGMIDEIVP